MGIPKVLWSLDVQLPRTFVVRGFVSMLNRANTERLKLQDFYICPNILHVDVDADVGGMAMTKVQSR